MCNYRRTVLFIISLLSICYSYAYDFEAEGIYYNVLSATTLEVTKGDKMYSGNIVIPYSVTYNGKSYSVTAIEKKAFQKCSELISIKINDNIKEIGESTFSGCSSLETVKMGKNIQTIGDYAFYKCSSLKEIPFYAKKVGKYAFAYCTSITEFKNTNMETIPVGMFLGCTALTSISFNAEVICNEAFNDCTSLTGEVTVRGHVGKSFHNCSKITSVVIESAAVVGGTSFYYRTFTGCTSIEKITLKKKDSVKGCANVYLDGSNLSCSPNISEIAIEGLDKFYKIVDGALYTVEGRLSLLPTKGWGTVYVTPDFVGSIGSYSLSTVGGLRRVVLCGSKIRLLNYAFTNCNDLEDLYIYSKAPKDMSIDDKTTFTETQYDQLKVYVPKGCKELYKNAAGWRLFKNIEEFDPLNFDPYSYTSGIKPTVSDEEEISRYSINGNKLKVPSKGVNIIKMKNGTTKKVVVK